MAPKTVKSKKTITTTEANAIIDVYYKLKNRLYNIGESEKYTDTTRKLAKKATKALEKWRRDSLDIYRMSGYKAG